jgi:hypothetical protein
MIMMSALYWASTLSWLCRVHYENQNLSNRLGEVMISVFDSNVVDRWFE